MCVLHLRARRDSALRGLSGSSRNLHSSLPVKILDSDIEYMNFSRRESGVKMREEERKTRW